MFRYMMREYFHKTLLSIRFIVVVLTIIAALLSLFQGMADKMKVQGLQAGAFEILPAFLFSETGIVVFFGVFVFIIAAFPSWEGSMNQILRMGKRKWILCQYVYVLLTSVIYYLIWTVGFILSLLPVITWNNEWSSLAEMAVDPGTSVLFWMDLDMNVNLQFSELIIAIGRPLKVYLLTFLLTVIGSTFVGILMVTLNICFRRGIGTLVAYIIVGVRTIAGICTMVFGDTLLHFDGYKQVKNLMERMQYYISPLYQSDLFVMAIHNARPIAQRVEIGVTYFLILMGVAVLFGMWMIRRIDLCQE